MSQRCEGNPMLCPGCGNEIDTASTCPICENQAAPRRSKRVASETCTDPVLEPATSFCVGCGNTIYGAGPCTFCETPSEDASTRPLGQTELCADCGNEVAEANNFPIC